MDADSPELLHVQDVAPLTTKQRRLLDAIRWLRTKRGIPPTYDELADRLGVRRAAVAELIRALENKGYVTHDRYKRRSLELTDPHTGAKLQRDNARLLPLLCTIHADSAVFTRFEVDPYVAVPQHLIGEPDARAFVLRVNDDSMARARIFRGDIVVVQWRSTAENDQIVVALVGTPESAEVATIARYHYSPRRGVELTSESYPEPRTIRPRDCRIHGVVAGSMRSFLDVPSASGDGDESR